MKSHQASDERTKAASLGTGNAEQLTIGTYFSNAGTRDAGGVVMYVQELVDALATHQPAYLYTDAGELTPKMRRTEAHIVQLEAEHGVLGELIARLPNTGSAVSSVLDENLSPLLRGVRDGTIHHINETVDILVTHDFLDDLVLSNLLDIPVVRVFHGFERAGVGMRVRERLSTGYSVVNSEQTKREFVDHLEYEPDGIVYPGVDIDRFRPDVTPAFDRDEWTILYVGRFVESKGLFDLVDAVAELPDDVHLHLVGRGDIDTLKRRIEARGIESRTIIEGTVPHDELPGYYASADVFCLPSWYESFGMVNVEAMACGTPVVTTALDGVTEYAVDCETAMLVPPSAPGELADAVASLRSSPGLRERLERNGRETAKQYSWERASERLVETCREIVADADSSLQR
ncbi:glycosyltransferase family 4 protein [Haladaptatus caseinilyticus]|uniref:glycosyltransferase family 4 protein n=1 Tax=Haladaptatus caseinilyticus TaxID=2993314 RepID=UPI00224B6C71|nr:glycosyltransferase family 4 protein [Haladaptatus caseinilyticus]